MLAGPVVLERCVAHGYVETVSIYMWQMSKMSRDILAHVNMYVYTHVCTHVHTCVRLHAYPYYNTHIYIHLF